MRCFNCFGDGERRQIIVIRFRDAIGTDCNAEGCKNTVMQAIKVVLSLYGSDFKSRNMCVYRTLIESLTRHME